MTRHLNISSLHRGRRAGCRNSSRLPARGGAFFLDILFYRTKGAALDRESEKAEPNLRWRGIPQRIEHWPLEKLIPYARNPRTHSDAQVAQIAASIGAFGFNNPILVDTKAGIIAGHGRLLAARKLQLAEVPVIVLDHLTEAQKRAYISQIISSR
jgi:hypothetical protein